MPPTLAQVLNTLAHELRTPLAVSQGYLKLYLDGRLQSPDDQRHALQEAADAVARLSELCGEVGAIAALSESKGPPVKEQLPVEALVNALRGREELSTVSWTGAMNLTQVIETSGRHDLIRAFALVAQAAVDDARGRAVSVNAVTVADGLHLLVGVEPGLAALASGPDDKDATAFNLMRSGRGLSLIWAALILNRSNIHVWQHATERAAVGFRFPSSPG